MALLGPLTLVGSLALLLMVVVPLIISGSRRQPDPATDHLRRRSTIFTIAAAAAAGAAIVALVTLPAMPYGLDQALAPLVAGIAMTLVILVHEATWPRPTGQLRSASLDRRTLLGSTPRWLARLTASSVALLWLIDLITIAVAEPGGRTLTRTVGDTVRTHSPFSGTFYALPTLTLSLVLLAATGATLWVIANRSGLGGDERDAAFRRLSAHRVLRGTAFGHLATVAGHAAFTGSTLGSLYPDQRWAVLVAVVLYAVAGTALLASLAVLVLPSTALVGLRTPAAAGPTPTYR